MKKRFAIVVAAAVMLVILSTFAVAVAAPFGSTCKRNVDCATGFCANSVCSTEGPCANFIHDNGETDVDCGGVCAEVKGKKCPLGKRCVEDSDCSSGICTSGKCASSRSAGVASPQPDAEEIKPGGGFALKATILLGIIIVFIAAFALYALARRKTTQKVETHASSPLENRRVQEPQNMPHHYRHRHEVFEELEKTYSRLSGEELFEHLRKKIGKK